MLPLADLNPEQTRAATRAPDSGPLLVVAGAGTGKTQTLATRLAWLVHEQGCDPQRVLLLTFSRRAAADMARRAARLLRRIGEQNSKWPDERHLFPYMFPYLRCAAVRRQETS